MNRTPSKQQEKILNKQGKFIVNACAGSGKTLTLSKKLVKLINNNTEPNRGIATLSFTNTAWEEIKKNFDEWGLEIRYPNFIGTFDRFINKYIFYQYYYLLEKFDKRPLLVGDLGTPWIRKEHDKDYQQYFDIYSFDKNDDLIKTKEVNTFFNIKNKYNADGKTINGHYKNLVEMKYKIYDEGFVTQDDINYFSLKLLEKFDFISENIANKFPIFLIDESQDTNDIKMSIMKIILSKKKIKGFTFIGDFNQAIYEWNGAKPELFEELTEKYDTVDLNENWRSSQNICNLSSKLSGIKYTAVNDDVKDYSFIPVIDGYDEPKENKSKFFNDIINEFIELCNEHKIKLSKKNVSVLCKGNTLIKIINGQNDTDYDDLFTDKGDITYDLINARFLFDQNKFNEAYLKIENILISIDLGKEYTSYLEIKNYKSEIGFFNMKKLCFDLINIMPSTIDMTLNNWIKNFKLKLRRSDFYLKKEILRKIKIKNDNAELLVTDLFDLEEHSKNYTLSTIHGVKGKTFDATLLILKTKTDKGTYETFIKNFKKTGKMKDEDLRNVYVGVTRPRKILVIAVPEKDKKMWHNLLLDEPYREKNQTSLFEFGK